MIGIYRPVNSAPRHLARSNLEAEAQARHIVDEARTQAQALIAIAATVEERERESFVMIRMIRDRLSSQPRTLIP